MKIVVAVTGASGSIYSRQLIEALEGADQVSHIAVIFSKNGLQVANFEDDTTYLDRCKKVTIYNNDDFFAPFASGSSDYDAAIAVPCSMGVIGRTASGVSNDLITRTLDVMLKERRKAIFVVRETPYSLIHIDNIKQITLSGGIILPASPSFYSLPKDVESLCRSVTERILSLLSIESQKYRWGDTKKPL